MLQCGLLIPLRENSEVGLFQTLFIDIGDEQSIENDLSTYSSHLLNIHNFVKHANAKSLFLIDEFGTGTEPAIGGAIAEAALEELNRKKAYGVVTTHYSNLKAMAKKGNGIVNAAMLFDTRELLPLYRLKIGRPGSSFAFEIARKIGLNEKILERARMKSGRKEIDLDQRLQEVELEKESNAQKQKELEFTDNALKELVDRYEALNQKLQSEKQAIIHKAKQEAKEVLRGANRLIENSIREIKESQAEKAKVKSLRREIEDVKADLNSSLSQKPPKLPNSKKEIVSTKEKKSQNISVLLEKPVVGDNVRIVGQETVGRLEQLKGKNALVSFESITVSVKYDKLEKVNVKNRKLTRNSSNAQYNSILKNIHDRSINFESNVDMRGMRADEALSFIKQWIDEAILIGRKDLEILHGTGNGILRQIIRDYLSSVNEVDSFKDAHVDFGGSGKTLIKLV
jgi:DNA mismatch repair protein MutS2